MQHQFRKILGQIPKILLITVVIGCLLLTVNCLLFTVSYSQVSSSAFDPNCYQPKIGTPGVVDTIYGAHEGEYLGAGMLNIGPYPDSSYGRMSCLLSYPDSLFNSVFRTGPSFNLHKLNVLGHFNINQAILRRGHFRSPKYSDILVADLKNGNTPARIYWQDDQGNYDSSRYTILLSAVKGKVYNDYSAMLPYTTHISSDSVEDIVYMTVIVDTDTGRGVTYLLYFKGGKTLYDQGRTAISDSAKSLESLVPNPKTTSQGDFRGVGRNDIIFEDSHRNFFYYKNDPPFSMSSVIKALRYDTLFAQWQNPNSQYFTERQTLEMKALSKPAGDSSSDFLAFFETQRGNESIDEIRIFKGGKDFGANRWTADSAAFVIHEPYYYDSKYALGWGVALKDCGHMTGTNNRVLYVEGTLDAGFYGYEFFYVLGDAIDDKIDMEIGPIPNHGGAGPFVDTLVADNDNLQDIIMGESGFGLDAATYNGSIFVVHGSNKIPDKTNSVVARKAVDESQSHILAYPNPCRQSTVLTFDNCLGEKMTMDVVSSSGQQCLHEETPGVDGLQQYAVDLSTLSAGEYIINLSCPLPGWSSSVKIIKTGAAQTPWSFDLKKMVGR